MTIGTITTGIAGTSWEIVGSSNQRSGYRVPATGRMWQLVLDGNATGATMKYSDDGVTWTTAATGAQLGLGVWHASMAEDDAGNLHVIGNQNSFVNWQTYTRGVPNGADGWTWSPEILLGQWFNDTPPSFRVHRLGSGWKLHLVYSQTTQLLYRRLGIASDGTVTMEDFRGLPSANTATFGPAVIDFHHTGDGLTVKAGSPHLFVAQTGDLGAELRFLKGTYSAGTWNWPSTALLWASDVAARRLSARFDGSRFVCAYQKSTSEVGLVERDAADTTTTVRTVPALSDGVINGLSLACDQFGDFYVAAGAATSGDPKITKYTREDDAFSAWSVIEAVTLRAANFGSAGDVGSSINLMPVGDSKIRGIYATGTGPFAVHYADFASTNVAPDAPIWAATDNQAHDVHSTLLLPGVYSDRNTGDTLARVAIRRRIGSTDMWWGGTSFNQSSEFWNMTSDPTLTVPAEWGADGDGVHSYYARHEDAGELQSAEGPAFHVVPAAKVNPTITSGPTNAIATRTTVWAAAEEIAFHSVLLDPLGTVVSDSGWKPMTATSYTHDAVVLNGLTYTEQVTTRNLKGLDSDTEQNAFLVTYVSPATPNLVLDASQPRGAVTLSHTNPTPAGLQPAVSSMRVYRREVGGTEVRAKVNLQPGANWVDYRIRSGHHYQWRLEAIGANGAISSTGWVDNSIAA